MGFFHKTIKDAILRAEVGDLKEARAIIAKHRKKFKGDQELATGDELVTLQYLIEDWDTLLSQEEEWNKLTKKEVIERLQELEKRVKTFKQIMKRILEEEEIILE